MVQWQMNYSDLLSFRGEETSPNDLQILETSGSQARLVRPDIPLYTALAAGVGFFLGLALAYAVGVPARETVEPEVWLDSIDSRYRAIGFHATIAGPSPEPGLGRDASRRAKSDRPRPDRSR